MLYYPATHNRRRFSIPSDTEYANLRTVANQLASGFTIRMADTGAQKVQWQLRYSGLTDTERAAIESLFEASEGQLNTFTFLDPTDNLLMWSEDWTQAVWTPDPLLQVTGGVPDPLGGSDGMQLTNTGATTQQILQSTTGPSSFLYCFSVYVRSAAPATIQLVVAATGQSALTAINTGTSWKRLTTSGSLAVQQDGYLLSDCNCRRGCKWTHSALKWTHSRRLDCIRRLSTWAVFMQAPGFHRTR